MQSKHLFALGNAHLALTAKMMTLPALMEFVPENLFVAMVTAAAQNAVMTALALKVHIRLTKFLFFF